MRRYILVALVLCVLVGVACAWPASMGGWDYRKEITINNTGSNLTNYQLMFTVNRSAGSDSGFTTYLNGKCESDYDDIRFTTSDENTLCDYWIESSSSTVAKIWVEMPSIVNSTAYGSTKAYLYYGNSAATAVSNGTNTFLQYHGSASSAFHDSNSVSPSNTTFESNIKGTTDTISLLSGVCNDLYTGSVTDQQSGQLYKGTNHYYGYTEKSDVVTSINEATTYIKDHWYRLKIINSGTAVHIFFDSNEVASGITTNIPTSNIGITFGAGVGSGEQAWAFIHKYTATEPTISAWGSEESDVRSTTAEFSALPLTGNIPLTVYFTDESTGNNCTVDAWAWSFGDSSPNSTQQNPAHTYATTGLYNVILTAFNTTLSKEDTEAKTTYINATYDPNAPVADFTVTETCGNVGDTFYFIDFSTGGGLYAWDWSFGDGTANSTLRNPTHQYSGNGDYTVSLTVSNAYGSDTETKTNYISVPCPATPTPTTPTPTTTPTSTYVSTGYISVDSKGIDFILWKLSDTNTTQIYVDGELQNISGLYYGQYGLLPNTPHTLCLNNGECLTTNTNIDGFSVFWYWLVFIILIILVVISYKIPITYVPTLIYGIYLIGIYLPDISAGFNEYIIVGVLLIMGIIAAIRGMRR